MSAIIHGTNIDTSVISYGDPKSNPAGGKVVNIYNSKVKEALTIATPLVSVWGAKEGKDNLGNPNGKYSMNVQFASGEYSTPDADKFKEEMIKLENKIKADLVANSLKWVGKQRSAEIVEENFGPIVKYPKQKDAKGQPIEAYDYTKQPCLTIKLPCYPKDKKNPNSEKIWQTSVYDEEQCPLYVKGDPNTQDVSPLNFLVTESKLPFQAVCLIQCGGIWFVNGKNYVTWNLKQIIIKKPRTSSIPDDVCFLTLTESDAQLLKNSTPNDAGSAKDVGSAAIVDDEDEYVVPETVMPPAPPIVPQSQPKQVEAPQPVIEETTEPVVEVSKPVKKGSRVVVKK